MDRAERQRQYELLGRSLDERQPQQEDSGSWRSGGVLGDTAVGLAAGVAQLPSVATGLADTLTAVGPGAVARVADQAFGDGEPGAVRRLLDRPFSRAADAAGEATGFQPGEWAERLRDERYSPQMQAASEAVDESWGRVGESFEQGDWRGVASGTGRAALDMLRNPRTIQALVTESLPATVAGGLAGRALGAVGGVTAGAPRIGAITAAPAGAASQVGREVATRGAQRTAENLARIGSRQRISPVMGAAIGQGGIMAGYAMDEIDDEIDPQRAGLAALGIGVGGSLIGYGGARVAQRVGLVDIDTAIAGGGLRAADGATQRGLISRVAGGAAAEGVLQEMPQEALETIGVNWAEGEPLLKDVPRAAISGMLAGNVMGGAINIPTPRSATAPTDVIHTITQNEVGGTRDEGREAGAPLDASSQDTRTLMRYYLRLRRVAEQTTHADLQEQALERMTGVTQALERMGVPQSVLDLEMARTDYTDMRLQAEQMRKTYQQKLRTDPRGAQRILTNLRAREEQITALEQAYSREELEGPDIALIRGLQEQEGTEGYFRSRRGVQSNQLKKGAQQRLTSMRALSNEQLAYELARDSFNQQTNPDSPELRWTPMRLAVARERGLDDSLVREAYNREFTEEGQQAERDRQRAAFDAGATEAAPATTTEAAPATTTEAAPAVDQQQGMAAALEYMRTGLNETQQRAWGTMMQAVSESGEGATADSVIRRAAQIYGSSYQNLQNIFRRILRDAGRAAGTDQLVNITPERFMDMLLAAGYTDSQPVVDQATDAGQADASLTSDDTAFDADLSDQGMVDTGTPATEILGSGAASIVDSAGGSTANIGTSFDNSTRIAELQMRRNSDQTSQEERREIDAQIARLRREAEQYAESVAELERQEAEAAAGPQLTPEEIAELPVQLTAKNTLFATERSVRSSKRFRETPGAVPVETELNGERGWGFVAPEAQPSSEALEQQAEADRIAAENQAAADARRAERQQAAQQVLASPEGVALGQAWDKRAERIWPEGSSPVSWAELVAAAPEVALAWVEAGVEMMTSNAQSYWKEGLRGLFFEFAGEIANDQNTTQGGPVQQDAGATEQNRPVTESAGQPEAEGAAPAAGTDGAATGEAGPVAAPEAQQTSQGADPVLEQADAPSAPSAPVDAQAVEQADAARQADELAEWMLDTAADFDYDYQGRSLAPLAIDVTEHALRTGRRLTDQEAAELADRFGVPAEIVQSIATQPFGIEGLLDRRDPGARELRRRARDVEARRPSAGATGEAGPVAPSTRATSGTGPTVTVRGRRGRRQGTQQLQQGEAATAEGIDALVEASLESPGPDTSAQLAAAQQADTSATLEAHGVPSVETRMDRVDRILDLQESGAATTRQMLDAVREILGPDHYLLPLVDMLAGHASTQNVRFINDNLGANPTALGLYFHDLHAIHINADHYSESLFSMLENGDGRPDLEIAETVLHELVHAATTRGIQEGALEPLMGEMREAVSNVRDYVNANWDSFSDAERAALAYMMSDAYELMTMPMTSPDAISALRRIPATNSYNRNMLGRVVEMILDFLGLSRDNATALEEIMSLVERVSDYDNATTLNSMRQLDQASDTMLVDMSAIQADLQALGDANYDIDSFGNELMARMSAVDDARMAGDAEALRVAKDGLVRVVENIGKRAAQARQQSTSEQPSGISASAQPRSMPLSDRIYDAALAKAPASMSNWLGSLKNTIKRLGYLSSFSHDFVDSVKGYLPQAETYFTTIFNRLSERNQMHVAIQKIVDPVANFTARERDAMNTVLREMTYQETWGFQPDWVGGVTVDPAMARKFNALPPVAQKVVRDMFRYAYESNQQVQRQLRGDIITSFDRYIDNSRSDKERANRTREKDQALAEHDQRQIDPSTPYLPLKRWGEWAVVHKSQRFRQAEARKDRREINALKQDADHYQVVFAESEYAARQERDRMSQELGVEVEMPFQRMRYETSNEAIPFDLMTRLREEALGRSGGQMSPVDQRVASAIDKLYITALEESSVRKSELRRLKVEGAGRDMVRAFVEQGQGMAALSSAMKINKETRRVIADMKAHATDPKAGRQRNDRMMALNEVLARHAVSLETEGRDNWQQKVMGYTSIWMLLTSPAYYIQNSTQPFMLTYPVLAARFGTSKSMGAMTRAYKTVIDARRDTKADGSDGLMDPAKLTDPREQMLFTRLQRLGLLDVGIAADLGSLRDSRGPLGRGFMKAHGKMLTAVRWVEVYNRGVTALSSFRLQREKLMADREAGRNQLSDSAIDEQAMQYATKVVQTTQGDYSGPNAPRLIDKLPAGRLLTQFRKFQLIQIGLLTRTFHQAFKGATPGERAIGRRQMTYILAMHGMVGGAMGLPAANIIGYAVAKAFGDDDEPANAELLARRAIGDKQVADLVLRGLPARLGVDASTRLGMGLTFSIMPFSDVSASRDGFNVMLAGLAGPTAGLGAMFFDGAGQIAQGNVAMGMTQFMPAALKNATRAYLYKTDGVRLRNGDLALSPEELTLFSTVTQGLGWPGKQITDRYFSTAALREVDQHFRRRTAQMKRAYTEAFNAGDREAMAEVRDEWRRLQDMRREYGVGLPQSVSVLARAPREQRERERLMVEGVAARRTQQRFVEMLYE